MGLTIEIINLKSGKHITFSVESKQEALRIERDIIEGKIKLASEGPEEARIFNALSLLGVNYDISNTRRCYKNRTTRKPPRNVSLMGEQDISRLHQKTKG